jgi:hypothetical protein
LKTREGDQISVNASVQKTFQIVRVVDGRWTIENGVVVDGRMEVSQLSRSSMTEYEAGATVNFHLRSDEAIVGSDSWLSNLLNVSIDLHVQDVQSPSLTVVGHDGGSVVGENLVLLHVPTHLIGWWRWEKWR